MSLKKLSAGSGYEYLTRQVAAADSTELRSMRLADYYAAKGEAPGRWIGSGLVGIDGLGYGDVVTDQQMKNLFGDGSDPVTGAALGRAFQSGSVAGFDLTFSPAKTVSALWAVAPPEVAQQIRQAHNAAVLDAVDFLESHAIFTREGTGGARQIETRGMIAAAFLHRDSRAGDPDLHTHVAVANKVQTRQGKWLSIYGKVLYKYAVAASEAYNTALEAHLREGLGVRFLDVPRAGGKRPVREISGVDTALCARWSRRRSDIEDRHGELAEEFTLRHGRPLPRRSRSRSRNARTSRPARRSTSPLVRSALPTFEEAAGGHVIGSVSVQHDPMDAIENTLAAEPLDEIMLAVTEHGLGVRLHQDLEHRLAHLGIPVKVIRSS